MTILKDLSIKIKKGDLDSAGHPLQVMDTIHRSVLMSNARGKYPAGQSQFKDPLGIATYYGFGADGNYYEGGVQQRTWHPKEVIDDFTDRVRDPVRWTAIGNDFSEGGINPVDLPFGKRLFAEYVGPGAELYDRKGQMTFFNGSGNLAVLSGRVTTLDIENGLDLDNCILLAVQQVADDNEWLFVGFVNTATYPFSVVQGEVAGGVATVTASQAVPVGTTEMDVAIEVDYVAGQYRGFFSLVPIGQDYTDITWSAVGAAQVWPAGWPVDATPRVHASFPVNFFPGERHSLSDIRSEDGDWVGQQQATWYLETFDTSLPYEISGTRADCPDELLINWGRNAEGETDLVLIDVDTPTDPRLWRRWPNIGLWKNSDFDFDKYWSPGWIDADEGHIVLTRDTMSSVSGAEEGEIWLFSLRWDKVVVFNILDVSAFPTYYDDTTGRMLREASTWGSRRWNTRDTYAFLGHFDGFQYPLATTFVGTLKSVGVEVFVPAITYGVSIRRTDDNKIYLAYGIQEVPTTLGDAGQYFAGIIELDEDNPLIEYNRYLFRKNTVGYNVWDESDDAWVMVGLSYDQGLWWLQAGEDGQFEELDGVLCRRDFSADVPNNVSVAPYNEDSYWHDVDLFMGKGINLNILDGAVAGNEIVHVVSGWKGGSHLTVLWYNSVSPGTSLRKTYGNTYSSEVLSHELNRILPYTEFPRWISLQDPLPAYLSRCKTSFGAGVGEDSFSALSEGIWLSYVQWKGLASQYLRHGLFRGLAIDRGDFVLELIGKYVPPFAAGYKFQAANFLTMGQKARFTLGVQGEKRLEGIVSLLVRGNSFGGPLIEAQIRNSSSSGDSVRYNSLSPPNIFLSPGSLLKLRIKRVGHVWLFLFYNAEQAIWQEVLRDEDGIRVPLIPFIRVESYDNLGLACSTSVEWDSFTLAPGDDALGNVYYRPVQYPNISSLLGQLSAGMSLREAIPTSVLGSIVTEDSWIFPGIMPMP